MFGPIYHWKHTIEKEMSFKAECYIFWANSKITFCISFHVIFINESVNLKLTVVFYSVIESFLNTDTCLTF